MSEPESLATDESLAARLHRHRFDRMVMLSDGIFAISTTLAALEIRLPDRPPDLAFVFHESGREIAVYMLSFTIIAALWVSNRELFARLKRVDGPMTLLTLALLCVTALIPAVTHHVRGRPDGSFSAYLLTMSICGVLNAAAWTYAAARRGLMLDEVGRGERWRRVLSTAALPIVTTPYLFVPADRVALVMLPLFGVLMFTRRVVLPRLIRDRPAREVSIANR